MLENNIIQLFFGNLVGVGFGLLMYRMANTTIKENTIAFNELLIFLKTKK